MARDCILYFEDCRDEPIQFLQHAHLDYLPWLEQISQATLGRGLPPQPDTISDKVNAFVDKGCWKWQCPSCGGHYFVSKLENGELSPGYCLYCTESGWRIIAQPTEPSAADIETELLKMPGHRAQAPLRDWKWGWDLAFLEERTELALKLQEENPGQLITHLSPVSVRAWAAGEILTAPNMVAHLNNPISQLQGYMGVIEPQDSIKIGVDDKVLELVPQNNPAGLTAGTTANGKIYMNLTDGLTLYSNEDVVVPTRITHLHALRDPTGTMYAVGTAVGVGVVDTETHKREITAITAATQNNRVLLSRQGNIPQWSTESVNAFGGGGFLSKQRFDSSGTWTKPDDTKLVFVQCWGGGGGGASSHGGGGGAYTEGWFDATDVAATVAVTVAAAATGVGGSSSFGTHLSAEGGNSGSQYETISTSNIYGQGGSAYGLHDIGLYAGGGRIQRVYDARSPYPYTARGTLVHNSYYGGGEGDSGSSGGNSVYGGGGGGNGKSIFGGDGGTSTAPNGDRPGGGGYHSTGANGGPGRVQVWSFSG